MILWYNLFDKPDFDEVRIWQCGIHGEVAENTVKVVCIAIYIKAMQNEVLIQTTL